MAMMMSKLTALQVQNKKDEGRLADGGGLSFEITKTGVKRWLYRYRLDNKQQMIVLGRYPEISLTKAREKHREAKKLVKEGKNPAVDRRAKKQANTAKERAEKDKRSKSFKTLTFEWVENKKGGGLRIMQKQLLIPLNRMHFRLLEIDLLML